MTLSHDDIMVMARAVGLDLPPGDVADVAARANALLAAVADLEIALAIELNLHEPIPPIAPATPYGDFGFPSGLDQVG